MNQKDEKITTANMEMALAIFLDYQTNLIVPNVHWGFSIHECDLLLITNAGYAWEIEIKISKADLIQDKRKKHRHQDRRIKNLYFAIPEYLTSHIEHIPERAGIIVVKRRMSLICETIRDPISNKNPYKFSYKEKFQIARLGTLRIWGLKRKLKEIQK